MHGTGGDLAKVAPFSEAHRVAIVVLPGVVPLDLAVPLQVFGPWPERLSGDDPGLANPYSVVVCGPQPSVRCGPWLAIERLEPLEAIRDADTVLVPGCAEPVREVPTALRKELAAASARGTRIASICVGAFALAGAGVLDGHRATTHWQYADELRNRHPLVDVQEEHLYIDDGQVLTSAGVLAASDLCLHMLRRDAGPATANTIARFLVSPPHREGGQAQYINRPVTVGGGSLAPTRRWLLDNLQETYTLRQIADHAHVSIRTLTRRFLAETGETAMNWLVRQRLSRARLLLEGSDQPVSVIAQTTGFGSMESMRTHFHALIGTSPQHYRRTFRGTASIDS